MQKAKLIRLARDRRFDGCLVMVVIVVIAIVPAAFPRFFEFMTATLRLRAMLAMPADSLIQVPFCLLDPAMTPVIVPVQSPDRHSATNKEQQR